MAAYSEYTYLHTLSTTGGGNIRTSNTVGDSSELWVVTEADDTADGSVANGEAVDINGTTYYYHENATDGGIIVTDGTNYFLLSDTASYPNNTVVGATGNTGETYDFAICFLPGTLIATPEGERAIETLAIGDLITMASGEQKAVKWIGEMSVTLNLFNRHTAAPVLIKAGALGNGLPKRDLYTSYNHGFEIEGVMVNAGVLVNGTSIVLCTDWAEPSVKYYQVEVEGHELMLAEGTAAETFLDGYETRSKFDNAAEFHALYPEAVPAEAMALGRVTFARQLPRAVKARIEAAAVEMGYTTSAVA